MNLYCFQFGSVDSAGETPSYISNLEVKSCSGEGSARATECENSKMLPLYFKKTDLCWSFFLPKIQVIMPV